MMLKKIDTQSKTFNNLRLGTAVVGELGFAYGFAHIAGSLYRVCCGKKLGLIPYAIGASVLSGKIGEYIFDSTTDIFYDTAMLWNELVDIIEENKNGDEGKADSDSEEDDNNYDEDLARLNDFVVETKLFEFKDRETAERTFNFLKKHENYFHGLHGKYITVQEYIQVRATNDDEFAEHKLSDEGKMLIFENDGVLDMYGWTPEMIESAYIDPMIDGTYLLNLVNYKSLKDELNIIK